MRAAHKTASHDLLSFSISRSLSPSSRFSLSFFLLLLLLCLCLSLFTRCLLLRSLLPCLSISLSVSLFVRERSHRERAPKTRRFEHERRARVALDTRGPHGKRTGNPYKSLYNARQRRWLTRAVRLLSILSNQREARRSLDEEIHEMNGRTRAVCIVLENRFEKSRN